MNTEHIEDQVLSQADFTSRTFPNNVSFTRCVFPEKSSYLNFFPDFIRMTDNSDVEVRSRREGERSRMES
jgi:hypothetical protein